MKLRKATSFFFAAVVAVATSGCNNQTQAYCFSCGDPVAASSSSSSSSSSGGMGGGAPIECTTDAQCSAPKASCCDGVCFDTQTDLNHCGGCGITCDAAANGESSCQGGLCGITCADGYRDCNLLSLDGCEVLVPSDPLNCGMCGNVCAVANASPGCNAGQCAIGACKDGYADCNMMAADGCEVDLGSDAANCHDCGHACVPAPNANPACIAGSCGFGGCLNGFGDCNVDPSDGCEISLASDVINCGACGNVCVALDNAAAGCINGVCGVGACTAGFGDCDKSIWSGCESDLSTDVNNCGGCGQACPAVAHGYPACSGGMCVIGGCAPGFDDCDKDPSNGCEADLAADISNCGACGNACPAVINGSPICAGFLCGLGSCAAGYADCFGGLANGCETDLLGDVNNCGACGNVCPAVAEGSKSCDLGVCGLAACSGTYANCNGLTSDGCEINIDSDLNNCGSCGNVCPMPANGTPSCKLSSCGLASCNPGYSDCNGSPADGCEFDTSIDPNNCGGCGIKCGSGTCVNSQCTCQNNVLVIIDDSASGATSLSTALTNQGFAVTQSAVPSYQYDGTNPPLAGFGAVVLLAGGPLATSYSNDMPAGGQQAIYNFVKTSGNGLVLTEWAALQVSKGRWQTLAPLVLLNRTVAYSGQVTYTVDAGFANHPIWTGLPASFTFASTSNVGIANAANGGTRAVSSPQALDAVALSNANVGRVVHIAHAGNYAPNGWTNANMQKLVGNAVGWVQRCK
jgi:hypothetical protein